MRIRSRERKPKSVTSRRELLRASGGLGLVLLLPTSVGCASSNASAPAAAAPRLDDLPKVRPDSWDPLAFNRARGNAGAIPEAYRAKINGPDGDRLHLGKHLPYTPSQVQAPAGMLALMWGDPSRGYAKHPNARRSPELPTGHWFDWIRMRRATPETPRNASPASPTGRRRPRRTTTD